MQVGDRVRVIKSGRVGTIIRESTFYIGNNKMWVVMLDTIDHFVFAFIEYNLELISH